MLGDPVDGPDRALWEQVEVAVASGRKATIIETLEAAENHTLRRFGDTLKRPLPDHVRVVLGNRFQEALRSYDRIRAIRQAVS